MSSDQVEAQQGLRFALSDELRTGMVNHARQEAPRECCGVLIGHTGCPERFLPLRNVAVGNRFYEIDPAQLIDLEFRVLPRDDSEIVAIYHSHPESPAYPSQTDIELAFWPEAIYLICSLEDAENPVIRGFQIREGNVSEAELVP